MSNIFSKSNAFIVAIIAFCLGLGGFASLKKVNSGTFNESTGNLFADILLNFPTWIGTFLGVFVGAFLAYQFNRKKQLEDDKKINFEKNQNNFFDIKHALREALSELWRIHNYYADYIESQGLNDDGVARGFSMPHMTAINTIKNLDVNLQSIYIIARKEENFNLIVEIKKRITHYNKFVTLFEARNDLAKRFAEKVSASAYTTDSYGRVSIKKTLEAEVFTKEDIRNFLLITEILLEQINKTLPLINLVQKLNDELHSFLKEKKNELKGEVEYYDFDLIVDSDTFYKAHRLFDKYEEEIHRLVYEELSNDGSKFKDRTPDYTQTHTSMTYHIR